jgi:hypothetical protein
MLCVSASGVPSLDSPSAMFGWKRSAESRQPVDDCVRKVSTHVRLRISSLAHRPTSTLPPRQHSNISAPAYVASLGPLINGVSVLCHRDRGRCPGAHDALGSDKHRSSSCSPHKPLTRSNPGTARTCNASLHVDPQPGAPPLERLSRHSLTLADRERPEAGNPRAARL